MNYSKNQDNNNPLFVFTHIPKTAGEVFKRNIESSLSKNQVVRTSFNYHERFYNISSGQYEFYQDQIHFEKTIQALTNDQINTIKILCGHDSYYGIHTLINRDAKYITFIRDPLKRTLSMYNYKRLVWDVHSTMKPPLDPRQENALSLMKKHFLVHDKVPSFEEWLECHYDKTIPIYGTMSNYLRNLGFFDLNSNNICHALDKFYFIGTSETYDRDSHFLYHLLNVNYFSSDKNASIPHVTTQLINQSIINKIQSHNKEDIELFNLAISYNKKFKRSHKKFYLYIKISQSKEIIFLCPLKLKDLGNHLKIYIKRFIKRILFKYI